MRLIGQTQKQNYLGCSPSKFAERFPTLSEIKAQTMRDGSAADFVDRIVEIATKLSKINEGLASETDPVRTTGGVFRSRSHPDDGSNVGQ